MLGGSAPTQTPGAPFRTESDNRAAVWPSPTHQGNLFNRGYNIYSLFPGSGDAAKTLYASTTKTTHGSGPFPEFVETQKVPDTFFPARFTFGVNGTPQFASTPHSGIEREVTELKLSPKTYNQDSSHYSSDNKTEERNGNPRKESKRLSNDVVIIKTEIEELNKDHKKNSVSNVEGRNGPAAHEKEEKEKIVGEKCNSVSSEVRSVGFGGDSVLANEPDSTGFGISTEAQKSEDITTSEFQRLRKDSFNSENEVEEAFKDNQIENDVNKEKCNIKVADLNVDVCVKPDTKKKFAVKVESVSNETCNLPTDRKFIKTKTADVSKTLSVNVKKPSGGNNDLPKSSPTRMLSLPPQNGGCSRTTPVTFKHQQETDPKLPNLNIEVPPLAIKKEPSDFQKFSNGTPFLSPTPLDFFSPSGLRVVDGPLLSPVPYSDSLESSSKRKENFLSPISNFLSSSPNFLSPRPSTENSFLSPTLDEGECKAYRNYRSLSKIPDHFLMNSSLQKMQEGVFLGSPGEVERRIQSNMTVMSSTQTESEKNQKSGTSNVTPCQVAEVTSASALLSPKHSGLVVKQEAGTAAATAATPESGSSVGPMPTVQKKDAGPMLSGQSATVSSTVGATLSRPKCQQRLEEIKMSFNVPSQQNLHTSGQSPISVDVPSAMGGAVYSGGMACDDRSANLITTWPTQSHNSTLWQYSAPVGYPPFPPVGFQLVRDPMTGHFLLIPASNIEALQRAILWPSYQPTPPQMIIPPITVQPSTPHLLLDTNVPPVDFLTSDAIHHSNSPHRLLITTDSGSKRKITTPTVIKLEASDCSNAVVVTSCNNNVYSKPQTAALSIGNEAVYFNQRPSATIESGRRSQATSPAPCLTASFGSSNSLDSGNVPTDACQPQTATTVMLQDASNQTDIPLETKKQNQKPQSVSDCKDKFEPYTRITEQNIKIPKTQDAATETVPFSEPEDDKQTVLREIQKRKTPQQSLNIQVSNVPDVDIKKEIMSPSQVDLSGLELLSNSIEQFVCEAKSSKLEVEEESFLDEERKDLSNDACEGAVLLQNLKNGFREVEENAGFESESSKTLGGLGLLCALAEQRFQEEIGEDDKEDAKADDEVEETKFKNEDEDWSFESDSDIPKLKKEIEVPDEFSDDSNDKKDKSCKEIKVESRFLPSDTSSAKRGPGRPRKLESQKVSVGQRAKSQIRKSKEMSPPVLQKETDYTYNGDSDDSNDNIKVKSAVDILKPPTLEPSTIIDPIRAEVDSPKRNNSDEPKKRKFSNENDVSSSKKRKVGRPKKHPLLHDNTSTETIVAKKPKTKSSFYLQTVPAVENSNCLKTKNSEVEKSTLTSDTCCFKNDTETTDLNNEDRRHKKIRPKLKAEPKMRDWNVAQEEENENWTKSLKKEECKHKLKPVKKPADETETSDIDPPKDSKLPSCVLTTEHLKSDKFPVRTLTVMGGLFYAGQLSAIRAPDVYGITIDGERGNRPHIYSREEILKDSILEIKPDKTADLPPGTRCCAYWSEQYRCLYPGTVSVPASPDPELDDKFVNVEFDDGDSGRINIDDIRLLPVDYPIIEYDPNPLQSLSKRKRRISGVSVESHSTEQKSTDSLSPDKTEAITEKNPATTKMTDDETEPKKAIQTFETGTFLSLENERRHLKKKRREKLKRLQSLSVDGKKKHKKHRCSDEHRHHRHHKKHRKHKHKHGKRHSSEMNGEAKKADEKSAEGSGREKEEQKQLSKKNKSKCKSVEKSCRMSDKSKTIKPKKCKERTESVESRSKMAAFLPARQLWGWCGKGYKRPGAKGRARKEFYKTIQRGKERITIGDCAVFLSTGRPDRPYIGRIESMWESWGTNMIVKVKWFYHPEETVGCPATLEYPGALFESPHVDENDVQTISHKCEVLPLKDYIAKLGNEPHRYETIYDNNDVYYLAGYYDPSNITLKMEPGVK